MRTEHREGMVRIEGAAAILKLSLDRTYKLSLRADFPRPAVRQSMVKFWCVDELLAYASARNARLGRECTASVR